MIVDLKSVRDDITGLTSDLDLFLEDLKDADMRLHRAEAFLAEARVTILLGDPKALGTNAEQREAATAQKTSTERLAVWKAEEARIEARAKVDQARSEWQYQQAILRIAELERGGRDV